MDPFLSFIAGLQEKLWRKKKTTKQQSAYDQGRQQYFEAKQKLADFLRDNPRPQYHSTQPEEDIRGRKGYVFNQQTQEWEEFKVHGMKTGKYGRIYGTNASDWKQTKAPAPGKKLDLNKGKWKPQFTVEDVIVIDVMQITGQDIIKFVVKDLFVIELNGIDRFEMARRNLSLNMNIDKHTCKQLVEHCIQIGVIPTPMEELV